MVRDTETGLLQRLWLSADIGSTQTTNVMIYDDLSVSIWLSIGKKVHSIQMMNPGLFLQVIPVGIEAEFLCKTRIVFFVLVLAAQIDQSSVNLPWLC